MECFVKKPWRGWTPLSCPWWCAPTPSPRRTTWSPAVSSEEWTSVQCWARLSGGHIMQSLCLFYLTMCHIDYWWLTITISIISLSEINKLGLFQLWHSPIKLKLFLMVYKGVSICLVIDAILGILSFCPTLTKLALDLQVYFCMSVCIFYFRIFFKAFI